MQLVLRKTATLQAIACLLGCLIASRPSLGQEMPSPLDLMGTDFLSYTPIPADRLAAYLLQGHEIVADGEFFDFPQPTGEKTSALSPEIVRIRFRIHRLYKGAATDTIEIELMNDMLVFPGAKVARYVVRELILERRRADLKPVRRQRDALERLFTAGDIGREQYVEERDRLNKLIVKRKEKDGLATSGRQVGLLHGWSFYDEGGAIRPGQRFLIGANRTQSGKDVYGPDETSFKSTVSWGETRDYVLSGFEDPSPIVAPD